MLDKSFDHDCTPRPLVLLISIHRRCSTNHTRPRTNQTHSHIHTLKKYPKQLRSMNRSSPTTRRLVVEKSAHSAQRPQGGDGGWGFLIPRAVSRVSYEWPPIILRAAGEGDGGVVSAMQEELPGFLGTSLVGSRFCFCCCFGILCFVLFHVIYIFCRF